MAKIILSILVFLCSTTTVFANGIDEKIDKIIAPISDCVSKIVFYPITINGASVPILIIWLIVGAIVFTVWTKFIGIWGFKHAIKVAKGDYADNDDNDGEVSSFQALATALSGTVGLGNIAGVAVAISLGGPGAMFWMAVGAIFGMASKFVECTLGVKYRRFNEDGSVSGGPMHYLAHGLTRKKMRWLGQPLAVIFSILCIGGALGGGNMLQINQATQQLINITGGKESFFFANSWLFGLIIATIIAIIIIGGIKSIAKVTEKVVPFMCILYMIASIIVILCNISELPHAIELIIKGAFSPEAIEGGIAGVIIIGLRRSVQSNEAGTGSAPIAYAAVRTKEPVSQGFVSLLEPFIDTIILCSMTAFVIIITGMYTQYNSDISGVELTSAAFKTVLPFFPYVLAVAIILFALSTILSWSYYGQKSWNYLFGEGKKRTRTYQLMFCSFIVIGSSMNLKSIIDFTDAMMLAMAVPNMLGMYILMPELKKDLAAYCQKFNVGMSVKNIFNKESEEQEIAA
ncbi:MAG: alanine/glycine:cation symporter family protein [Candidatus Gastranaerophilales bacterium]|nr:alanine/glycine:cation symporter family protein [Candidatus Gastranaerophilales bacterium]